MLRRLPWVLAERQEEVHRAETLLREAVRDLVLAGYSWADVGRMLGVSRQAARQRFGADVAWWREHMGAVLPWDDYGTVLDQDNPVEAWQDMARLLESGPIEDLR